MKKVVSVLFLIILTVSSIASASSAEPFTFRDGIVFGMTKDEVVSRESSVVSYAEDNYIVYLDQKSAGNTAYIMYTFSENDALTQIYVIFTDKHSNDNKYIDDFDEVDLALKAKYGMPKTDSKYKWSNSLYKDDKEDYGFAISLGHLSIGSRWEFEDVIFTHLLIGDNYKIDHAIYYETPELETQVNIDGI